jgi:hypothetical protein
MPNHLQDTLASAAALRAIGRVTATARNVLSGSLMAVLVVTAAFIPSTRVVVLLLQATVLAVVWARVTILLVVEPKPKMEMSTLLAEWRWAAMEATTRSTTRRH